MMAPVRAALPWFVIVNPAAGPSRARRRWPALRTALERHGIPFTAALTAGPGHAQQLAVAAVTAGARRLLVVGGDGSLHEVLNGLWAHDPGVLQHTVIAVAPCGSGNDWARTLDFPGDPTRFAARLAAGRTRRVDLGLATCRPPGGSTDHRCVFHNVAGAGIDAAVLRRTPRRGPRALAYLTGLALALPRFRAPEFRISTDRGTRSGRFFIALAALGPDCGGGLRLAPGARPDDGLLDLVAIDALPLRRALARLPKLFNGRLAADPAVHGERSAAARIECDPPGEIQADGQLIGTTPLTVQVLPGALGALDCRG